MHPDYLLANLLFHISFSKPMSAVLVLAISFFIVYQILYVHIQNIRYLEQHFQTWLSSVANVRINNAETFSEFLSQPSLLDATFFKHFFYSVHGFVHCLLFWFCLQRYKISCYKKSKEEENSPY